MTARRSFLTGLATLLIVLPGFFITAGPRQPQPVYAVQPPFDHSNCQYPDRWTNPPNSCDNSDPAVPECIKAFSTQQGEADCIAAFVAQNNPQPAVVDQPVTVIPAPETASKCGK